MLFDLHVHTSLSPCSRLTIREILDNAAARGLAGVCLTDHDSMGALAEIDEGPQPDGLVVLVGMEYTTPLGDILLFGPFEDLRPGLDARTLLPLVRRRGGVAVSAHPRRAARPTHQALFREGLVGHMEALNGRNSDQENLLALRMAADRHPVLTGGSDAHSIEELGRCCTRFEYPITSREDLVRELLAGRCHPESHFPGLYAPAPAIASGRAFF